MDKPRIKYTEHIPEKDYEKHGLSESDEKVVLPDKTKKIPQKNIDTNEVKKRVADIDKGLQDVNEQLAKAKKI